MLRWTKGRGLTIVSAVLGLVSLAAGSGAASAATTSANWTMSGQSVLNWRSQPSETTLSPSTVGTLHPVWTATMAGDVTATPAVYNGVVYVPDWGGKFTAFDAKKGTVIWRDDLGTLLGQPAGSVVSRTGPAISGNTVYISTQGIPTGVTFPTKGGMLLSIDATTGALNWAKTIDVYNNKYAIGTQSPVVFQGVVYAGVSSTEENAVANGAPCCTFRGNFSAFAANTGQRLWHVDTLDDAAYFNNGQPGFTGVGVWGSTPVIDAKRGLVYITTGNDYSAPQSVKDCQSTWVPGTAYHCEDAYPGNHVDSVMAVNMSDGSIAWSQRLELYDAWNVACITGNTTGACPDPAGPDYDFGQGAMLLKNTSAGDILVAGQKSGMLWGLDPSNNGKVEWSYKAGPGSSLGGLEWGSSTDGSRIYYAVVNLNGVFGAPPFTLTNPAPGSASTTNAGLWGAVDAATGKVIWQQADPNGTIDLGPVSNANGVVYASSFGPLFGAPSTGQKTMFALDAATGKILWSFAANGSNNASPAIANGTLYWGTGYSNLGLGDAGNMLYAFQK